MEKVGPVAYKLALLRELSSIHNIFHVSILRRYRLDPSHVIHEPEIEISKGLKYVEEPMKILDRKVKQLRNKEILIVKVN